VDWKYYQYKLIIDNTIRFSSIHLGWLYKLLISFYLLCYL